MNLNATVADTDFDEAEIDASIKLAVESEDRVYQKLVALIKPSGRLHIELQLPRAVEVMVDGGGRAGRITRKYTFVVLDLYWSRPCSPRDSARSQIQASMALGLVKHDGERWVPGSSGLRFALDELISMFPSASAFLLELTKSKTEFCDS